ncbi:MAG: tetraacyldisaccharide 4'-kinase [Armatimonadota bacterium]|nr:tetraacyldisaccharide 4'-kinase [Armatimonadota bacterium]
MEVSRRTEDFLLDVVYGGRKDLLARLIRLGLLGLSWIYRLAIWLYLLPFHLRIRRKRRLCCPVISVGNLTVGGTGKTPAVRYVCDGLIGRGWNPAVLSYGYGGILHGRFALVSDGKNTLMSAVDVGDEPVMLARQLKGVPILTGKDREHTGRMAVQDFGANVCVLDDGLQVWKLHRDLDIVLVDGNNPFDNGRLIPAGRLREPPNALKKAGIILITGKLYTRSEKDIAEAVSKIKKVAPNAKIFITGYRVTHLTYLQDGNHLHQKEIKGRKVFVLSSIARPEAFEQTVERIGATIAGRAHFRDHHLYSKEDLTMVCALAKNSGAEFIVTTEKDSVKLSSEMEFPVVVVGITMYLDDEEGFWNIVANCVKNFDGPK